MAWLSKYIHYEVWDEIDDIFPDFNYVAVEVWEFINNFYPRFTGHVIIFHAGITLVAC